MLLFEKNWEKYYFLAVSVPTATAEAFIRRWPDFPPLIYICKQTKKLGQPLLKR